MAGDKLVRFCGGMLRPAQVVRGLSDQSRCFHTTSFTQSKIRAQPITKGFGPEGERGSVPKMLAGGNAGAIARADHREWQRELFEPSVASGLILASALAGYRIAPVYL